MFRRARKNIQNFSGSQLKAMTTRSLFQSEFFPSLGSVLLHKNILKYWYFNTTKSTGTVGSNKSSVFVQHHNIFTDQFLRFLWGFSSTYNLRSFFLLCWFLLASSFHEFLCHECSLRSEPEGGWTKEHWVVATKGPETLDHIVRILSYKT